MAVVVFDSAHHSWEMFVGIIIRFHSDFVIVVLGLDIDLLGEFVVCDCDCGKKRGVIERRRSGGSSSTSTSPY